MLVLQKDAMGDPAIPGLTHLRRVTPLVSFACATLPCAFATPIQILLHLLTLRLKSRLLLPYLISVLRAGRNSPPAVSGFAGSPRALSLR
jgi:hypothetical protein